MGSEPGSGGFSVVQLGWWTAVEGVVGSHSVFVWAEQATAPPSIDHVPTTPSLTMLPTLQPPPSS